MQHYMINGMNVIRTVFARRGVGIGASRGTPSREDQIENFEVDGLPNPTSASSLLFVNCASLSVLTTQKTLFSVYLTRLILTVYDQL
jgi:hypothetical protein